MEPAYERRENRAQGIGENTPAVAAMEPAYERRENPDGHAIHDRVTVRRNGARL